MFNVKEMSEMASAGTLNLLGTVRAMENEPMTQHLWSAMTWLETHCISMLGGPHTDEAGESIRRLHAKLQHIRSVLDSRMVSLGGNVESIERIDDVVKEKVEEMISEDGHNLWSIDGTEVLESLRDNEEIDLDYSAMLYMDMLVMTESTMDDLCDQVDEKLIDSADRAIEAMRKSVEASRAAG